MNHAARARLAFALLAPAGALCACAPALEKPSAGTTQAGLDPKLANTAWIEEGNLVALIASSRATGHRLKREYVPIEVAVVNRGMKSLTLTRESFVLIDVRGNRYPLASVKEIQSRYQGSVDVDRRTFTEIAPILLSKYASYAQLPSNFSPGFDHGIARDRISLPRYAYVCDFLYFPTPEGYAHGEPLELQLTAPELGDAVFVRFTVAG